MKKKLYIIIFASVIGLILLSTGYSKNTNKDTLVEDMSLLEQKTGNQPKLIADLNIKPDTLKERAQKEAPPKNHINTSSRTQAIHIANNQFHLKLDYTPTDNDIVYLEYTQEGIAGNSRPAHAINDGLAQGGYFYQKEANLSKHKEEVPHYQFKQGDNTIRFSTSEDIKDQVKISDLRLTIERGARKEIGQTLAINIPEAGYYNNKIYLRGFVTGTGYKQAVVKIGDYTLENREGIFEGILSEAKALIIDGKITVTACFGDKAQTKLQVAVSPDTSFDYELPFESYGATAQKRFTAQQTDTLTLGNASLCVAAGSLNQSSEMMSITALRDKDLPPLPSGMVNVTGKSYGYRFLPHGNHFKTEASIHIPYDKNLIPEGYTEKDIRPYYYPKMSIRIILHYL